MGMTIDNELIKQLFDQAAVNPRLRMNFDLRTSPEDGSQRMLNALLPGTRVPRHRHPYSSESVVAIRGAMDEILYDDSGKETERIHLERTLGNYGCQIPAGVWHSVEVFEPTLIFEAKDGRFGEDGSERAGE